MGQGQGFVRRQAGTRDRDSFGSVNGISNLFVYPRMGWIPCINVLNLLKFIYWDLPRDYMVFYTLMYVSYYIFHLFLILTW